MESRSKVDEGVVGQPQTIPDAQPAHLEILGSADSRADQSLHPQTPENGDRPRGPINIASVLRLLEWQQYRCALTGRMLAPETASLDHIVPVREGGQHVIENVQVLHKEVNRAKSTLSHDKFIKLCREVVQHAAEITTGACAH
jgi:hypothetical protein